MAVRVAERLASSQATNATNRMSAAALAVSHALTLAERLKPQPGPQEQFGKCEADIAVIGGGAYGGKSYALLLQPLEYIDDADFRSVTFRRDTTQLRNPGGLWDEACGLYQALGGRPVEGPLEFTWPSGATTKFWHLEHEKSVYAWDSSQIPLIMFDQLESFEESQFWYMLSRNRDPSGKFKPRIRGACNPMPDSWLKRFLGWWIDDKTGYAIPERSGVIRWMLRDGDDIVWADTREELIERFWRPELTATDPKQPHPLSVTFIVARIFDNKIGMQKDPRYLSKLLGMRKHERERLLGDEQLGGNWNARPTAGSLFLRTWCPTIPAEPEDVEWARGWDLAATRPNAQNPDPDWTVGVKVGRYRGRRRFVVSADVKRIREAPSRVEDTLLNTARADGVPVLIQLPRDPGQAGKAQTKSLIGLLAGFNAKEKPVTGDKVTRFSPFSAQAEAGNVDIVAGIPEEYLRSLEGFPDAKHDDDADATSSAFEAVAGGIMGDQVIDYFKGMGAGPKKPERSVAQEIVATGGVPVVVPPPQATDVAGAAQAIAAKGNGAPAPALKLQTEAHRGFMFGAGIRYTADGAGVIVAASEEDALALIRAGCQRVNK